MINFIHCDNFYNDPLVLCELAKNLTFEDIIIGESAKDFNFIPERIESRFSEILHCPTEVQSNTGIFLKPNGVIHYDTFYEHSIWTCIVALEDTFINLQQHASGVKTFFDVAEANREQFFLNTASDTSSWSTTNTINIQQNDFVFVRPWIWKSYQPNNLVQTFGINIRID